MLLPLELPLSNDKLVFNLYDKDMVGDDLVCSMTFSLKEILKSDSSRRIRAAAQNNHKEEVAPKKKSKDEEDKEDTAEKPPDDDLINFNMQWVNLFGSNVDLGSGKHAE